MKIIIYSIIFVLAFGAEQALPQSSEGKPQAKEAEIKKEEVTFQNGGVTLSGDLCTPSGDGPFPVFIWCHGSGGQSRYSADFVRTFVKSGYAFLSWDKIGNGKSGGIFYQQSLTMRAREVHAAAEMLMKRKDIDPNRISFVGVSQAGYVLPRVIMAFPTAEKLVLVGPGSWSVSEEFAYQKQTMRNVMAKNWAANGVFKPNEIDEILNLMDPVYSASASNVFDAFQEFHKQAKTKSWYTKFRTAFPPPPETPTELEDYQIFLQEAFAFDAVKEYSGIPCPTLIMFGENDECVNPKVGIPNIQTGFAKSGNSQLTVKVYPGAGHVLNCAGNQPGKDLGEWLAKNPGPLSK